MPKKDFDNIEFDDEFETMTIEDVKKIYESFRKEKKDGRNSN